MSLLTELVTHFGLSHDDLIRIISTAPARYKVYEIPKRSGGTRTIAQPSRELKAIQRYVLEEKLSQFPIHSAAMAYVKGKSILSNANSHRHGSILLKLDFRKFFPSIKVKDWERVVRAIALQVIERSDIPLYSNILFWGEQKKSITPRCLSIGAPTSPMLSNIIMYDLDTKLSAAAMALGLVYTRYADDITVSGGDISSVKGFEQIVRKTIKGSRSPKLEFNDEKRGLYTKGHRRMVTGLVVTPTERISIGRNRKREISALVHRATLNQLDIEQRGYLKGMLGFCIANEISFVERMREKYGNAIIDSILTYRIPKRNSQDAELSK
jgi:hypothetical protein